MAIQYLDAKRIRGSSTAGDLSTLGTAANGSLIGDPTGGDTSPTPPSGLGTSSFNFDGNDAINIDGAEPFSTTVGSISLWWYNDGSTNDDMILVFGDTNASSYLGFETKTGGLKVAFRSSSATQWEVRRATGGSNGGTMSVGWHNMIVSQNGTAVLVYVDSVSITNFDGTPVDKSKWMESNIDNGRIGCDKISGNNNAHFFTGNIMEIGLWNVALTQTQVDSIFGNGGSTAKKANTEPIGLRAYYPLSGTTVTNELADYSDLPENTIFEETDTYKTYWLQSNAWKRSPTAPTDISGLYAWYDATDETTITKSSDRVSKWENKEGTTARDLVQTTSANQPLWVSADRNGKDVIDFSTSSTGRYMLTSAAQATVAQPFSIIVVVEMPSNDSTSRDLLQGWQAANTGFFPAFNKNSANDGFHMSSGDSLGFTETGIVDTWQYMALIFNTTSSKLRMGGVQKASGNAGSTYATPLRVGVSWNNDAFWNAKIMHVVFYNKLLSASEIEGLESWAAIEGGL